MKKIIVLSGLLLTQPAEAEPNCMMSSLFMKVATCIGRAENYLFSSGSCEVIITAPDGHLLLIKSLTIAKNSTGLWSSSSLEYRDETNGLGWWGFFLPDGAHQIRVNATCSTLVATNKCIVGLSAGALTYPIDCAPAD